MILHLIMYSIALYLYALGAVVASIFNKKIRKLVKGQIRTFGILKRNITKNDRCVWFHAASLGEFEQGRPLMEQLKREHPEYKILLTFFSPSGYEVRKNYEGADVICYLPFDTPGNVMSFLRLAHPEIAIFIKYEFWTNYLTTMKKRGIRVYSISSIFRPGQHFFKWWGSTRALEAFTHLFVQNEASQKLLAQHGIENTTVVGDTRFDRVMDIRKAAKPLDAVETFKNGRPTFIAGSSWEPDEQIYMAYFNKHRDWKIIIAPHVINEARLEKLIIACHGRTVVRYTDIEKGAVSDTKLKEAEVLIIDCFGKLSSIYRYGEVALVGGGFGVGIHNVPEAAVYGIPVLFGPKNKKFLEAQHLMACGGAFQFRDSNEFETQMDRLRTDKTFLEEAGRKAGGYILENVGATQKCYEKIFN